jgi:transcriptional regulator with XRE-family HTH domain
MAKLTKTVKQSKKVSYLAINLRFLRKLSSMTQEQAGKKFKISRSIVGAYEEDRAKPTYETLIKMSNWYNVTIDDLLKKEITEVYPK